MKLSKFFNLSLPSVSQLKSKIFITTALLNLMTANLSLAVASNQMLPTTEDSVSFIRLPNYHSSEWGTMKIMPNNVLSWYSYVGIQTLDRNDPDAIWQLVLDISGIPAVGKKNGVGSVVNDPADTNVYYSCYGSTDTSISSTDYELSNNFAAIYRSVDGLKSFKAIAGQDSANDFHTMGCIASGAGRYLIDKADDGTEIEGWKIFARNELFAFDTSETITVDGKSLSKTFYYLTYRQGLKSATYDDAGTLTWKTIHNEPVFYDDDTSAGTGSAGQTPSYDARRYEYQQTGASVDPLLHYPPQLDEDGNPNCNYEYDDGSHGAQFVYGNFDESKNECIEDEHHSIGTDVALDPVALEHGSTILFVGYITHPVLRHGGLYYGIQDGLDSFAWTELKHPTTSERLDVRDIELDTTRTVTLENGLTVTSTFYVAAGRHGVFKGTVNTDGSIELIEMNTGFYTREQMLAEYPTYDSDECAKTDRCGQAHGLDQEYVDGKSYLILSHSNGTPSFAIDDFESPLVWYEIDAKSNTATLEGYDSENWGGFTEKAIIDPVNKQFIMSVSSIPVKVDISSLSSRDESNYITSGAKWYAFHEGFGDRQGFRTTYDPVDPDHVVHMSILDYGSAWIKWDNNKKLVEENYKDRTIENGLCYRMYYVDSLSGIEYSESDSDKVNKTYITTLESSSEMNPVRKYVYGNQIETVGNDASAVIYTTVKDNDDYYSHGITRAEWNADTQSWKWHSVTGETSCVAKYPSDNSNKNSCYWFCEKPTVATSEVKGALPYAVNIDIATDPKDRDHLFATSTTKTSSVNLYETTDGGASWLDISAKYHIDSKSMSSYKEPKELVIDPNNSKKFYVAFESNGIFSCDTSGDEGCKDITALQPDDGKHSPYLAYAKSKYPQIEDIQAVNVDGKTRLFLAAAGKCDSGTWGVYPKTEGKPEKCGQIDHAGLYARNIDSEDKWTKLNYTGEVTDYFEAEHFAVSPVNPDYIAVGGNEINSSGGGLQDVINGVMYTRDGGKSWHRAFETAIGSQSIGAHPSNENKFVVSLNQNGIWELNLNDVAVEEPVESELPVTEEPKPVRIDTDGDGLIDSGDPEIDKPNRWWKVNRTAPWAIELPKRPLYFFVSGSSSDESSPTGFTTSKPEIVSDGSKAQPGVAKFCPEKPRADLGDVTKYFGICILSN